MCGITGSINFKLSYSIINSKLLHRGPDEQRGLVVDNIDLYHHRLAIQDISSGQQPMQLNNRYTIIFNGEIYNHQELRKQFHLQGKTASDTETILLLFQKQGIAFLQHLEGMFALAIYDNHDKKMFLARDRAGKKPLYYFKDDQQLVFSSELNCLKGLLPLEMEQAHFYQYLRLGSFYGAMTPYKKVYELKAGHFLTIDCTNLDITNTCWWSINAFYDQTHTDSFEQSLEKVDHYLHAAVKRRVESSDLEVGSFLSGGIDSGLATAIASQYHPNIKTFTVSFAGEYDEAPLAQLVANQYQTNHTEIKIGFDHLKNDLETIFANYGEPFFDSSAVPSYYVSAAAKKHLTVIINGDGADELFGGYRRYVPFASFDFFNHRPLFKTAVKAAKHILPPGHHKKSVYNYFYRLLSLASKNSLEVYLSAGVDIFENYEDNLLSEGFDYLQPMRHDFNTIADANISGLRKIMNLDFNATLFSQLLTKMDIASMAHSLEGRSPFLCKELLEYAPGMRDDFKIKGGQTKYLLRQLAKKYLPADLINQPKRGFEIPLKKWVEEELKEMVHDYVGAPNALTLQFVKKEFIDGLLNNTINISAEKRAKILWTLMSMEIWHKKVYLQ